MKDLYYVAGLVFVFILGYRTARSYYRVEIEHIKDKYEKRIAHYKKIIHQ